MDANYGTPITPLEEQPKKDNKRTIIIVVVVLLLCCCCVVVGGGVGMWLWNNGDALLEGTQLLTPLLM